MTPERQLVIIEHQTLDITHHLGRALHNTHQSMQDGYPTRSPGDGNPGGGSITATSRPPRHALLTHPDPARTANDDIRTLAQESAETAAMKLLLGGHPGALQPTHNNPIAQAVYAHRAARLIHATTPPDQLPLFDHWLTTVNHLHRTILRWAWTTHTPTPTNEQLATDLTDMWCRRHLAHGLKKDRYRGDLCQWCYRHHAKHGEHPTEPMIEAHEAGNWRRLAGLINAREAELATMRKPRKRRR